MKRSFILCLLFVVFMIGCSSSEETTTTENTDPNAPILDAIGNKSVQAGNNINFTVTATDPNNESLTYSTDGAVGMGNPYEGSNPATFNMSDIQIFDWTPTTNEIGSYEVEFSVENQSGKSDSERITISVTSASTGGGGSVSTGEVLFTNNCSSCHGSGGGQACVPWSSAEITAAISGGSNVVGQMSGITLTSTEVDEIVSYVDTASPDC